MLKSSQHSLTRDDLYDKDIFSRMLYKVSWSAWESEHNLFSGAFTNSKLIKAALQNKKNT